MRDGVRHDRLSPPARSVASRSRRWWRSPGCSWGWRSSGRGHDITTTDLSIARELRELAPGDAVRSAMRVLTHLGATDVALPLVLLVAVLLYRAGDRPAMVALSGAYAATQAIVTLVKVVVERARPDSAEALSHAGGYAFPSGHSATAVVVYGALALIAARHGGARARAAAIAGAVGLAVLVGITRVYLGVHFPSDVLAGWLLGGAVLAVVWRLAVTRARRPSGSQPVHVAFTTG